MFAGQACNRRAAGYFLQMQLDWQDAKDKDQTKNRHPDTFLASWLHPYELNICGRTATYA